MRVFCIWGLFCLALAAPCASTVVNLLPEGALQLFPDEFDDDKTACTHSQVLNAKFDGFALPTNATSLAFHLQASVDCIRLAGTLQRVTLFSFGLVDVLVDCSSQPALLLSADLLGRILFPLPTVLTTEPATLALSIDSAQPAVVSACLNGVQLQADSALGEGLLFYLVIQLGELLAGGVTLGTAASGQRSARATFTQFWLVTNGPLPQCIANWAQLRAGAGLNRPPSVVAVDQQPPGDAFVGDTLRFTASGVDADGDSLRAAITFYGVPPQGCVAAECGNQKIEVWGSNGAVGLAATVQFPLPGRFLVRVELSDGGGGVSVVDHSVLVRKIGDTAGRAPCCRHSPYIVAQQLGRPIDQSVFRATGVFTAAQRLGWSDAYMSGADLEAERLFDYSVLAPPLAASRLDVLSCMDVRLAGAGSPVVYGLTAAFKAEVAGHNKALVLVPSGFPWAGTSDVECQQHWSGWQDAASPQFTRAALSSPGTCSVACTKAGTEHFIRSTGMVQQYTEALIQASYGALSLSPHVQVTEEVLIDRGSLPQDSNYSYYETPARAALEARGLQYWMYLQLVPLAYHRRPPHRAWSGGVTSKGAVITQCYASMYYSVHETGHRLGFKHANMYQLNEARAAPANPLGPGQFVAASYTDRLDVMSCCKSDYGLFHRTLAGWLKGSGRVLIPADQVARPSTRRLTLWPFDRSESRGRLVSVAVRRSDDEILLVGFRSAPHWQDSGSEGVPPQDARENVRGIQVEYLRKQAQGGDSASAWSQRGLLDYNVVHGDWPDALPGAAREAPRMSQFALLKEGHSWYDPGSGLLLALERLGACDGPPGLPPHNHMAPGFYGYRGEWPSKEQYAQADFSGYSALECAQLLIKTSAPPPAGRLDLNVSVTVGSSSPVLSPASSGSCTPQATTVLSVRWPAGAEVSSAVWKDAWNRTLADESPEGDTFSSILVTSFPISVHVLAADGRHTRVEVGPHLDQLQVQYKYYEVDSISAAQEALPVPAAFVQGCSAQEEDVEQLIIAIGIVSALLSLAVLAAVLLACESYWHRRRVRRATSSKASKI